MISATLGCVKLRQNIKVLSAHQTVCPVCATILMLRLFKNDAYCVKMIVLTLWMLSNRHL